jgi:hypothetical protein
MTYQEILDQIEAYQANKLDDMRFDAIVSYQIGKMVVNGIERVFGSSEPPKQIHELYPTLFRAPELKQENSESIKAKMMEYAQHWNAKFKKKGE